MDFYIKIANLWCSISTEDTNLRNYFKEELDYSPIPHPSVSKVLIERFSNKFEFTAEPFSTNHTVLYKGRYRFKYIDYLARTMLAYELLSQDILFFHASAIIKNGRALVFLGPSTAGKSTVLSYFQPNLRLADDTAIIKINKNGFFVYRSPFDFQKNIKAKDSPFVLKEIFLLKKDMKTKIEKIVSEKQVISLIKNSLSLPKIEIKNDKIERINERLTRVFYKNIIKLLASVKFEELHFKKNRNFLGIM